MSIKRHIVLIWIFFLPMLVYCQSEAEIKVNAEQLFEKEQYVAATPLYLRLLSLQPRDFNYNYKYGACLIYNSNKKQDAIRYLAYAVTSESVDPAVHYFLARAYHLNYQFNDAIKEYQKYQTIVGVKGKFTADAVRNVEMCRNGKKLLSTITEIIVTKKSEIEASDFFRIYDLANIGGSFVVAVDFQSKMDKKMNHIPLVHFPQGTDKIFYSSYGEGTQKDIYMVLRLPNGKFSLPQIVTGGVNSPYEEDYPYMHPSGNYLYFSSKGHNSMGGFDVFRSSFDPVKNTFGPAENIDFAISSPDDDILYVVDKDDKNAYFASSRQSQDGKLFVYKVKVDRYPIQLAVVKGYFESGINPKNKSMTVEVFDKLSEKSIGIFNTTPEGTYLVTFPKGGKYEYHVTVDGSDETFICQVEIPYLKEFKPLKQKMFHEVAENKENVRILNLFNEEVDDAQAIIAQVLKDRSDLNVNVDKFDANELEQLQASKKILAEIGASEMSVFEVGQMLQRRSIELANVNKGLSKEENAVNALVIAKTTRIKEIDKEIKELVKEADQSESDVVQHSILMEAKSLIAERKSLIKSIAETEKVGSQIGGGDVSKLDQQNFERIQKEYNDLLEEGKEKEALQVIKQNDVLIKNVIQGEGNQHEAELIRKQKEIDANLDQQKATSLAFEKDIEQIETEIRTLEVEKENAKEKFKAEIQDKIDYKKQQSEEFKAQRNTAQSKQTELAEQRKAITDELEMIRSIQNYSGSDVSAEQVAKAKGELGNENAKTISQYVESQISELIKNNPSLENSKGNLSESAKLIAIHNSKAEEIIGDAGLSESERNSLLKQLNSETLNQLQERHQVAKSELTKDKFNSELAKELSVNESFATKLKAENEKVNQVANTNYSAKDVEKDLLPTYQSNVAEITNNSNLTEKEKWNALNEADNKFSTAITKELSSVENELTNDPKNEGLIAKKKVLETKQTDLKNSIEKRTTQIAAVNETESTISITENSVIADIDPSYSDKKKSLDNTSTDVNELNKIQSLDEDFLNQLNESLAEVKENVSQNPRDEKLIKEKQILESLIAKTSTEIANRSAKLKEIEATQIVAVETKTDAELKNEVLAAVPLNIATEIDKIEKDDLSSTEKQQAIIDKHSEYLVELEKVKSDKLKTSNANDPENQRAIDIVDELIQSEKSTIEQLKSEQATNLSVELPTKESVMTEIDPSFNSDIAKIQKTKGKEKYNQLIEREQDLQVNLENKIAAIQSSLSNDPSNESFKTELNIVTEEYQASIARVGDYAAERTKIESNSTVDSKAMIAELRTNLLTEENKGIIDQTYKTIDELKSQDVILADYEISVSQQLDELKQLNETTETKKRTQEIDILEKELTTVQKKRRTISVSIGEIEQSSIARTPENTEEKIEALSLKETELQAKLAESDLTPKEKKNLGQELALVSNEKAGLEIPVTQEKIELNKAALTALVENENPPTSEAIKEQLKTKESAIEALLEKANKEKTDLAKNYLLNEALELQEKVKINFMEAKVDARNKEIQQANNISVNESRAELESKVRRFSVEVGEITQELDATKKVQEKAKSSKKAEYNASIESLEADLEVATIKLKEAELALSRVVDKEEIVAKESVKTEVTFDEEFQIASTKEYEQYAKAVKSALDSEDQISNLEKLINEQDAEIKKLIEEEIYQGADHTTEINEKAQKIRTYSVEIGELQAQLAERKKTIAENTPSSTAEQLKFENLVMRGVNPIEKSALAFSSVPLPTSGIEINATGIKVNYTESNPIPVDVESPSGLVYRVQVGAFARPIPQDLFKEFTPVSGEKIGNTNITRYMAGFFNNSDKVVDARDQIKALGYSDAFIVAYCDGERITFGEARNLEKSGKCVPKGTNEMMLEVAQKTAITMGYEDTSKEVRPVSEYAYNQAPGAAKADAIEKVEGLFFTVQIAVHNRPVTHEQLLNLDPLMTLRLPNGQIRYSCGKFLDLEKAKVLQSEIRAKGIIDAFVTAYYNGERVGWQKGLEIQKQGNSVMANLNPAKNTEEADQQVQNAKVIEVFSEKTEAVAKPLEKGIQLVSNQSFDEYPRDVLNRYNTKGSFYFDEHDHKVKSVIYDSEDHLPRIQGFKSDIDTVYLTAKELRTNTGNTVLIKIPKTTLDGDFADWMLKMNYRRSIVTLKTGIEIRIFDVRNESLEKVKNELVLFGLTMEVQHGERVIEKEEWEQQK